MMKKGFKKLIAVAVLFSMVLTIGILPIAQARYQGSQTQTQTSTSIQPMGATGGRSSKLLCYWSFDEGSGDIAHDSVGGNDGAVHDCNWVQGHSGTALQFISADSSVSNISGKFDDAIGNFFSFQAWFFWYGTDSYDMVLFDSRDQGGVNLFVSTQHKLVFSLGPNSTTFFVGRHDVPELQWAFVELDYNATCWTLYLNGLYDAGSPANLTYKDSQGACIGNSIKGDAAPFTGIIDEVKIYGERPANQPPNPPVIQGPTSGKAKQSYDYTFNATDPNRDNVSYYIDWGDNTTSGWTGPYPSGVAITQSHTWTAKGTYTIKAKAKDIYGNESDWETLSVTMPLSYEPPHFRFLDWLLERFPNAFPILRYLLRNKG